MSRTIELSATCTRSRVSHRFILLRRLLPGFLLGIVAELQQIPVGFEQPHVAGPEVMDQLLVSGWFHLPGPNNGGRVDIRVVINPLRVRDMAGSISDNHQMAAANALKPGDEVLAVIIGSKARAPTGN